MSETVIQLLVLGGATLGVGLLCLMNVLIGGWVRMRFATLDTALSYMQRDVLGFEPGPACVLAEDRMAALFAEANGQRIGLVAAMGDQAVVRALYPTELRAVSRSEAVLSLRLSDYTLPSVVVRLQSEALARDWEERLTCFSHTSQEGADAAAA